jgi:hypothetical protein
MHDATSEQKQKTRNGAPCGLLEVDVVRFTSTTDLHPQRALTTTHAHAGDGVHSRVVIRGDVRRCQHQTPIAVCRSLFAVLLGERQTAIGELRELDDGDLAAYA